ncbi:MAG: type II toxin-antitoxin system RelE/ParE family toxin [Acidobacteriota bacterium]
MLPYRLIPAAEADLKEIARYTIQQWGREQAKRYDRKKALLYFGCIARTYGFACQA